MNTLIEALYAPARYHEIVYLINKFQGDINERNIHGRTLLSTIASLCNGEPDYVEYAQMAIDRGADVTLPELIPEWNNGIRTYRLSDTTPLHYAHSAEMITFLVQNGADPDLVYPTKKSCAVHLINCGATVAHVETEEPLENPSAAAYRAQIPIKPGDACVRERMRVFKRILSWTGVCEDVSRFIVEIAQ